MSANAKRLGTTQLSVLIALNGYEQPVTTERVARNAERLPGLTALGRISDSSTSASLNRLAKRGLVNRYDTEPISWLITDAGREVVKAEAER